LVLVDFLVFDRYNYLRRCLAFICAAPANNTKRRFALQGICVIRIWR